MSKELAVLLTVAAGGLVAAQAPANNVISNSVGSLGAALVSFLVGTAVILVLTFTVGGGLSGDEGVESPAWYYWILGGVGGAAIVLVTLITVRELGAGGATAAVIAGQLALSVVHRPRRGSRPRRAGDHLGEALGHRAARGRHGADRSRLSGPPCLPIIDYLRSNRGRLRSAVRSSGGGAAYDGHQCG